MKKYVKRVLALTLALLMVLPLVGVPVFAESTPNLSQDFESYEAGTYLSGSGNSWTPFNKVLEENGDKFLRLPFVVTATDDSNYKKTEPTNAGKWITLTHSAFSTTQRTVISVDLRLNGKGGTNPYAGLWLRNFGYTNTSGEKITNGAWFRLFNVNLLTGDLVFYSENAHVLTGAAGLNTTGWNHVEINFNPADGSFMIFVNGALYATCSAKVAGTNFTVAANQLMYVIDGANKVDCFTQKDAVNEDYSNCNSLDADNFHIAPTDKIPDERVDFSAFSAGQILTTSNGFTQVAPYQKVLDENGNKFLRLPFAVSDISNPSTTPTNRGNWLQFKHSAFSTTELTRLSVDIRINGKSGTNPYAGLWLRKVGYTNTAGEEATENYFQLFNVNLLTGALVLPAKYKPVLSGAAGLNTSGWNTVEVVFNPANGHFDIYVNGAIYASCVPNVAGSDFTVASNQLMYAIDGANNNNCYVDADTLDDTYSNCNYMDADNFVFSTDFTLPEEKIDFNKFEAGQTVVRADGFEVIPSFYKFFKENGDSYVRLPIVSTQKGSTNNLKVEPTNRGDFFQFRHNAFPTTSNVSISMDLRMNAVGGAAPTVGVWLRKVSYTDVSRAVVEKEWVRLFDVNLKTGEFQTRDVNGKTTGARGLLPGVWNDVEVIFEPQTGSFDIYVNDALYKQCTAIVEGSNFVVKANQMMFAVCSSLNVDADFTLATQAGVDFSNSNYMDADNFVIKATDRKLSGEIYYSEDFNSYKAGDKVALGTNLNVTSTYEIDPVNPSNVSVKLPFGAAPNATEILMRMSGSTPLEHKPNDANAPQIGYFEVTRNAQTNAVEVDGWTVTPEVGGKYTVTDGTTTYTGLELSTKQTYNAYWGGDGVINQNWMLPNPEISYKKQPSVVISMDYYISEDANGRIFPQFRYYSLDGGSRKNFLDICTIDIAKGTIWPKGGSSYTGLNKGEWNNVMLDLNLISGVGKLYLNGVYLGDGSYGANLTLYENSLVTAKLNWKYADYKNYSGYFMVDNVKMMSSKSTVTVDADRLLYVEVDGRKIYTTSFDVPEGSTYKAVYFEDNDYLGMMTTEQANSIRLSASAGMRYATRLDMTLVDELYALLDNKDIADVTFGTLIAPTSYISTDFTMEALDEQGKMYLEVDASRDKYFEVDDSEDTTHFVGSIVNFYEKNISRAFSGRGYVKITFRSGQEIVLYSAITHSASVMEVATKALKDKDFVASLSATQKKILDTYSEGKAPAVPEETLRSRKLDGLNVLAVGDSLFNGDFVGYENQWLALMAKRHNWNMTNLGKNGWAISDTSEAPVSKRSIYNYLMNDPNNFRYGTTSTSYYNTGNAQQLTANDVDLILLEGGNNDQGAQVPFGTIDSTDPKTLLGGIRAVANHLLETYPNAKLVFITSWHFDSNTTADDGRSLSHMKYAVESMKMLYNAYYVDNPRVGLIDAGDPAISGVNMSDATWRAQYAKDKYHLNEEGMKIVANSMEELLPDALFVCDKKEGISVKHAYENGVCKDCRHVDPLSVKDEGITRVVCVGDSITANGYWKNNMMGYLDDSYEVLGFGVSGSTGLVSGIDVGYPKAYVHQDNHQLALRHNADAVVIMLGTNDSKPCNFASIQADNGAQYIKDMTAMVRKYQAACPDAQIFIGLPPTVYNDAGKFEGISEENVTSLIIPCLEQVAAATGATVVDVHSATANAKDHFSDGVHPSDNTGRALIAKAFADAIIEWKEN